MDDENIRTEVMNDTFVLKTLFKEVYVKNEDERSLFSDFYAIPHLGNNKQGILILTSGNEGEILSNSESTLLHKILAAIKISEEDVFISSLMNMRNVDFNKFIDHFKFSKLLFFGFEPEDVGWHVEMTLYKRLLFMNRVLVFSEALGVIERNEISKKKLWEQLQLIFDLK